MAPATGFAGKITRPGWGGGRVWLWQNPPPFQGAILGCGIPVAGATG
ncbi:MAG: hypothetical protein LV480_14010 [Methylacidiphilales bacterium]|nr:hypothetical protein [Candidatus Methylacidiphilales bacterium]